MSVMARIDVAPGGSGPSAGSVADEAGGEGMGPMITVTALRFRSPPRAVSSGSSGGSGGHQPRHGD
jgi:hypothetical protein